MRKSRFMGIHYLFLGCMLALSLTLPAQVSFSISPNLRAAYNATSALQFDKANSLIERIKREEPSNKLVYLIENYIDFFTIFIDEEQAFFKDREKLKMYRLNQVRQGDKKSPYYLYAQAEIRLQWALVRLKFEEYFKAFNEISIAYQLLEKNVKLFPDFMPNKKSLGILHALVGTIPPQYKWGVKLLGGMEGTISQGKEEIQEVIDYSRQHPDFIFLEETMVMYSFLLLYLSNEGQEAWQIIQNSSLNCESNPLHCFVLTNVAKRVWQNDRALDILSQRPIASSYHPFYYLDFLEGEALLKKLNPKAETHFLKYVSNFRGRNFIKEAYWKLAHTRWIQGDSLGAYQYLHQCIENGLAITDEDKVALRAAKRGTLPHPEVLKARLLFDGGYFMESKRILSKLTPDSLERAEDRLEWIYRNARIAQQIGLVQDAVRYFEETLEKGKDHPAYFATASALQLGVLYEAQGEDDKAIRFYKLCQELKPEEYRSSLQQKAKAGLNRLTN